MKHTTALFCLFVAFSTVLIQAKLLPVHFEAVSVRSHIFESLRPKGDPEVIRECGDNVMKPYGQLEQVYKRGQVVAGTSCSWTLRAPTNHRINIISVGFDLSDSVADIPSDYDKSMTSGIYVYDSEVVGKNHMTTFFTSPKEKAGGYVNSISTKENITIEVQYHDNVDYDTQHIKIKYEFLPADKIIELLRKY